MVWTWKILWQLLEQSPVDPQANPSCVLEKLLLHPGGSSLKTGALKLRSFKWYFWKIFGGEIGTGSSVAGLDLRFFANTLVSGAHFGTLSVFSTCRICTKSTIYLVLTNWTQSGDSGRSKTKTLGPAAYFGCKVHKGCSPLSARKFLLLHVLCHHFCVSCTAQAWPSSFTPVWPFQEKLVVLNLFLYSRLQINRFNKHFLSAEVDFKSNPRIVFYFYSWFFTNKTTCVLIPSNVAGEIPEMAFLICDWIDLFFIFIFSLIFWFG